MLQPWHTFSELYSEVLDQRSALRSLSLLMAAVLLGWWNYVPLHEFLHVGGCLIAGGSVSELQIDPLYGGHYFSRWFSFVESTSDAYAGRSSGFDTGGSDWVYASTVYFPYLPGLLSFLMLRLFSGKKSAFGFGLVVPWAAGPLLSLSGDFLELGSLALFQLFPGMDQANRVLISDDLFRLLGEIQTSDLPFWSTRAFVAVSLLLGVLMAWMTISVSWFLAERVLGQGAPPKSSVRSTDG